MTDDVPGGSSDKGRIARVAERVDGVREAGEERLSRVRERSWLADRLAATYESYRKNRGAECASGLAYYMFLALYPLLVSAASILAIFVRDPERVEQLMNQIIGRISPGLVPLVSGSTDVVADAAAPLGLIATLLFLWAAMKVIQVTQEKLARIFGTDERPVTRRIGSRLVFIALAMLVPLGLFIASVVIGRSGRGMGRGRAAPMAAAGAQPGKVVMYLVLVYCADLALAVVAMRYLGGDRGRLAPLFQGAALAAAGWFILQTVGVWAVQALFTSWATTFYGVAASTISMLIIANIGARVMLFSAEWVATAPELRTISSTPLARSTRNMPRP